MGKWTIIGTKLNNKKLLHIFSYLRQVGEVLVAGCDKVAREHPDLSPALSRPPSLVPADFVVLREHLDDVTLLQLELVLTLSRVVVDGGPEGLGLGGGLLRANAIVVIVVNGGTGRVGPGLSCRGGGAAAASPRRSCCQAPSARGHRRRPGQGAVEGGGGGLVRAGAALAPDAAQGDPPPVPPLSPGGGGGHHPRRRPRCPRSPTPAARRSARVAADARGRADWGCGTAQPAIICEI